MAFARSGVLGTFMEINYSLDLLDSTRNCQPRDVALVDNISNFEETEVPLLRKPKIKLLDLCLVQWEAGASSLYRVQAACSFAFTHHLAFASVSLFV